MACFFLLSCSPNYALQIKGIVNQIAKQFSDQCPPFSAVLTRNTFTSVRPKFIFAGSSIHTRWTVALHYHMAKNPVISIHTAAGIFPAGSAILTWTNRWTFRIIWTIEVPILAVHSFVSSVTDLVASLIVTCVMPFAGIGWGAFDSSCRHWNFSTGFIWHLAVNARETCNLVNQLRDLRISELKCHWQAIKIGSFRDRSTNGLRDPPPISTKFGTLADSA